MHLIIIPVLIIALIVGISESKDLWNSLDLSAPELGEEGLNVSDFLGTPSGSTENSPLRYFTE